MKPHKHDWHCGGIFWGGFDSQNKTYISALSSEKAYTIGEYILVSLWACSICGAVKELKSKEVVRT